MFRNASYAYKILGNKRRARDTESVTSTFVTALSVVGTDIVIPITREIALPLLVSSLRGIGYFIRKSLQPSQAVQINAKHLDSASMLTRNQKYSNQTVKFR